MTTACEGLTILELSRGMAGAIAGMVLADNGAEVIKIESPGGGPLRSNPGSLVWDRGKKSVVLDLKKAADKASFLKLVPQANGLIEDMRPGAAERMGIGYQSLAQLNPGLVYAAITGFGERGPFRDLPGYEHIVAAKTGRMASQEGFRPGPIFTPLPIASYGAGMLAVQALLAALYACSRTGRGQRVHTSLLHALTAYDMGGFLARVHMNDKPGQVRGVLPLAFMTPQCKDGRYLQMCSRQPRLFRNWMRLMGLEQLFDDPAFKHMPDYFPTQEDMAAVLEMVAAKMREKTPEEWLEIFTKSDVGADSFLSHEEFMRLPQMVENGRIVELNDPSVGKMVQIGPLANFSATHSVVHTPAPVLGRHTAAVLEKAPSPAHRRSPAPSTSGADSMPYPLSGVTVLECATFYAAPFSATLLAEMGARVIKIEPPEGDPMRRNYASVYSKGMQGKESVILNLKDPDALQVLYQLAGKADIFLHNYRPGVPERLRIDYATMSALNPLLIYMYASLYGSKGPWKHRPGFHSTPNALSGGGVIESGRGNPPRDRHYPDPAGALGVATAAMLALHARERTGKGQYVETTMLTASGYVISRWGVRYQGKPADPIPDQGQHGYHALHRLYETKEGWLFLMCPKENHWKGLVQVLGLSTAVAGPRFSTEEARHRHDAELASLLETALRAKPASAWETALLQAGIPAVRADGVQHADFMINHPQVRENALAIEDQLPDGQRFWRSSNCTEYSEMRTRSESPKELGWATESILRELGYSQSRIDSLSERGVTKAVNQDLPS
ncbi:MAG: CoA transferase [Dehalococcoidia bacterium]|nr:CoA transferase [Dehalococcoidia bacterium]